MLFVKVLNEYVPSGGRGSMIFEVMDYGQYPHGYYDTINDYGVKPHDHTLKAIVTELGMDVGEEQVLGDDQERKTKRSQMCCAIVCVLVALLEKEVLDKSTILSALLLTLRTPPDP